MFIQMGKHYVRMSTIESITHRDDFLTVRTVSGKEYLRPVENKVADKVVSSLLTKLVELEGNDEHTTEAG